MPPLRASMSSIEHFHIPEYSEDNTDSQPKEMLAKEGVSPMRSALPPFIHGGAQSSVQSNALQQGVLPARGLPLHSSHDGLQTWSDIQLVSDSTPPSVPEQRAQGSGMNTTVESHQRRQELAMQASFGAGGQGSMQGTSGTATFAGYSGPQQQGATQSYAMQSIPPQIVQNPHHQASSASAANQLYASGSNQLYASGSYQQQPHQPHQPQQMRQPHQASDLYASHGSTPQQAHDLYSSQNSLPMASQGMMQGGILNKHATNCRSPERCLHHPQDCMFLTVPLIPAAPQLQPLQQAGYQQHQSNHLQVFMHARSHAPHCQGKSGQIYRDTVRGRSRCGKHHYPRAMRIRTRAKALRHSNLPAPLVSIRISCVHSHIRTESWAGLALFSA